MDNINTTTLPPASHDSLWPWPDQSAQVFQGGSMWGLTGLDTLEAWRFYAESYRRAAERLFEIRMAPGGTYLLFPMIFLYRHHIELRMKELLFVSAEFLNVPPLPPNWKLNHDLKETWNLLRPRLEHTDPALPGHELDNITRIIDDLHKKDSSSFVFRYPTNFNGDCHLDDPDLDLNSIDIDNYYATMRQLSELLGVMSDCFHEVIRQRNDVV